MVVPICMELRREWRYLRQLAAAPGATRRPCGPDEPCPPLKVGDATRRLSELRADMRRLGCPEPEE